MTGVDRDQLAKPLVLVYWLALVGGLVLYTTTRLDDMSAVVALWVGALGGTMLGQYLALRDYRLWITVVVLVICALYCGPLVPDGAAGTALWQAFVAAVLCGFWSLGDRASIAACWFPAVIWMLSVLDRADGQLAPDGVGVTLLAGFAVLLLMILRARETRRVGLWRSVAAVPLARVKPLEVLREPPGRQLARAAWGLSVGAITVAITVWLAPRLWQIETLRGERQQLAEPSSRTGLPCCPVGDEVDTERARVKEYFDLGRSRVARHGPPREGVECRACGGTVVTPAWPGITRVEPTRDDAPGAARSDDVPVTAARGEVREAATQPGARRWGTPTTAPSVAPAPVAVAMAAAPRVAAPAIAPVMTTPPPVAPPVVRRPPPTAPHVAPVSTDRRPPPSDSGALPSRARPGSSIVPWLIALGAGALIFQLVALALRPVRRLITLRHLRRPFWNETIDQRVSNAWQLALVGLRDAGWRPASHEAPHALARRVGVGELARCATILERARHGLGLDAEDLDAMRSSADAAYAAARRGLGGFARAIGWIRWPLT